MGKPRWPKYSNHTKNVSSLCFIWEIRADRIIFLLQWDISLISHDHFTSDQDTRHSPSMKIRWRINTFTAFTYVFIPHLYHNNFRRWRYIFFARKKIPNWNNLATILLRTKMTLGSILVLAERSPYFGRSGLTREKKDTVLERVDQWSGYVILCM